MSWRLIRCFPQQMLILQLLPPCMQQQKQAAQSEQYAIKALGLNKVSQQSALVQCCLVKVCISIEHATTLEIGEAFTEG